MTSKVQILDVGINKPFKSHMRNSWFVKYDFRLPHLLNVIEDDTMSIKVTRTDMSKWIGDAWDKITANTIIKTSKKIGFIAAD
jgi:hypothetical protein